MMKLKINSGSGFTLIELLVVISIIGVLASVILPSLNSARVRAQYVTAQQELKQITDSIILLDPAVAPLMNITGSQCSECDCIYGGPPVLHNIPDSDACMVRWASTVAAIDNGSVILDGTQHLLRDPWNSPYLLDENEGEFGCTAQDVLRTVGPDGIVSTGDDYIIFLPFRTNTCNNF